MAKVKKLLNKYELEMILKSEKTDFNNFYKDELIQLLETARKILKREKIIKIEKEMYVRPKDSKIDGIGIVQNIDGLMLTVKYNGYVVNSTVNHYKKASFDPTDLIEVGDLVNDIIVENISNRDNCSNVKLISSFDDEILVEISRDNLRNIITREQLEHCKTEFDL